MRLITLILTVSLFLSYVLSFDNLDHQIFELQDELVKQEGTESNLYKLLNSNMDDTAKRISRNFRKVSLSVHPDKDNSEKATKKFALLGNAHKLLKVAHSRERYDFYLKNGFPVWRGTGYMYKRHRPGFIFVILFLFSLSCGTHYLILKINYIRKKERISNILEDHKKELSARDARKLQEQIDRDPSIPNDESILPNEFDVLQLHEPTYHDIFIFRLLGSSSAKQSKVSDKKE